MKLVNMIQLVFGVAFFFATPTTAATTNPTTTTAAKSACGLTEWDLSDGELTGTSVTLDTSGDDASAAVTINTAYQFAECTVSGDFKFALYEVDTGNGICSTTAVAAGLWTVAKVFQPTPGQNTATTTARVTISFDTAALAVDLQQSTPQIYSEGSTAGEEILSFCVRSTIEVDGTELKFSEMVVTATINTVLAIPAIENVDVRREAANVATTDVNVLGTVNAYECYKEGNTFLGWLPGAAKPVLTREENILTVCVTGISTTVECKEFWELTLTQGTEAGDVRVEDGVIKRALVTDVFVQAIKDTNSVDYKGCAAQLLIDASYFDSANPEKVTLSGSVRMGFAAPTSRRLLGDHRALEDAESVSFDVNVDRLQGSSSSSGATTAALMTPVLVLAAAVSM